MGFDPYNASTNVFSHFSSIIVNNWVKAHVYLQLIKNNRIYKIRKPEIFFWHSHLFHLKKWLLNMQYSSPTCHKHIKGRAIKSFWHNDTYNSPITSFNCMLSVNLTQIVFKKWYHSYSECPFNLEKICLTFL